MKRILSALFCITIFMNILAPVCSLAYSDIKVTINGNSVTFIRDAYEENGICMLPFKELMGKMGFFIGYDEESKSYTGTVNGVEAQVPRNSDKACYDQVWIELETPTVALDDDVLVETEFIEKLYGISCENNGNEVKFTVKKFSEDKKDEERVSIDEYLSDKKPKNINIPSDDLFKAQLSNPALVAMKEVEVDDAPGFTRAIEVENLTEPALSYSAQITFDSEESISAGDVLVATIYAKKIKCVDESGYATMNATYEAIDIDWTKFSAQTESVPETWERYQYAFVVTKDLKAGGAHFCIRVGFRYQTIQFGGLEVVNYGKNADISVLAPEKAVKTTYYGSEDGALWREEAFKRIEKYRKNDMKIRVRDEEGNPVPDAKVSANMTRSEFLWGTAIVESRAFNARRTSMVYKNILGKKFNSLVLESRMKPGGFDVRDCVYSVNFAREHNMYFRAHTILWDALKHFPEEITENTTEQEIYDFCVRHASRLIYNFGDSLNEMDVVNEPLNNSFFRDKYGMDFIVELYKTIHDMAPDMKLFVNETGLTGTDTNWASATRLKGIIDDLLEKGAPLDGLGIQDHTAGFIYPQTFYNQLDYVAENLKYIAITEYDYISNLPNNRDALQLEADYLRDTIIMAYSQPKMTGFTMWGFGDFGHWRLNAPLYFEPYTAKPALKYWDQYVWGEWFTQAEESTDENGETVIRGHRGEYDVTVSAGGKTAKTTLVLSKDGENTVEAVVGSDGIELKSSEEVEDPLPQISMLKAVYNAKDSEYEYKKLYENRAVGAVRDSGENVDFLLREGNKSICAVDKNSSITVKLREPQESGYITIKTANDKESLLKVEAREDNGEWKQIYAGESYNGITGFSFDKKQISEIRITGLVDATASVNYISIALKENRGV